MPARPGGRGGAVEGRFPEVTGSKQVDPKDPSQYTTPKSNK